MNCVKCLIDKIHALKSLLTRTTYLEYQKFVLAYQDVTLELNLSKQQIRN